MATESQEALELVISDFEAASTGPDVKQSLIMLLIMLNSMSGNVKRLGAPPDDKAASEFLLKSTLEEFENKFQSYVGFTRKISKDSASIAALLKRGDAYNELYPLLDKIRGISGDIKNIWTEPKDQPDRRIRNIEEALNTLNRTIWAENDPHSEIVAAIKEGGGTVYETDNVLELANRIANMANGSTLVKPLTVTSLSATYPEVENQAYGPITVDIASQAKKRVVTTNNVTIDCSNDPGYEGGYSEVEVRVPVSGSGSGGSSGGSGGSSGSGNDDEEENDGSKLKLDSYTATANGPVQASDFDCDGFNEVYVNVDEYAIDPDKRFTVTFMVEDQVVYEKTDVKPFETVEFPGEIPEHPQTGDIWYFKGWDPVPYDVIHDMVCVAQFGIAQPNAKQPELAWPNTFISDSWDVICEDGGAHYPYGGSFKPLYLEGLPPILMQKVWKPEGGATSVWMARTCVQASQVCGNLSSGESVFSKLDDSELFSWNNCVLRRELNNYFINKFPEVLKNRIVPMTKYHIMPTLNDVPYQIPYLGHSEGDYIWIPGIHELNIVDAGMDVPLYRPVKSFQFPSASTNNQQAYNNSFGYFINPNVYPKSLRPNESTSKSLYRWIEELGGSTTVYTGYKVRALLAHPDDVQWNDGHGSTGDHWDLLPFDKKLQIMQERPYAADGEPPLDLYKSAIKYNNHFPLYPGVYSTNPTSFTGLPLYSFDNGAFTSLAYFPLRDWGGENRIFSMIQSLTYCRSTMDPINYIQAGAGALSSNIPIIFGFGIA